MKEKKWFVYLIRCLDRTFYTGITVDIEKRINAHKKGKGSKYIRARGFDCLIGSREFLGKSQALKEELRIKKLTKEEKIRLFSSPSG